MPSSADCPSTLAESNRGLSKSSDVGRWHCRRLLNLLCLSTGPQTKVPFSSILKNSSQKFHVQAHAHSWDTHFSQMNGFSVAWCDLYTYAGGVAPVLASSSRLKQMWVTAQRSRGGSGQTAGSISLGDIPHCYLDFWKNTLLACFLNSSCVGLLSLTSRMLFLKLMWTYVPFSPPKTFCGRWSSGLPSLKYNTMAIFQAEETWRTTGAGRPFWTLHDAVRGAFPTLAGKEQPISEEGGIPRKVCLRTFCTSFSLLLSCHTYPIALFHNATLFIKHF